MKVVLIEPKASDIHFFSFFKIPRLGLPLLGALLKEKGHEVKIFCEELAPIDWSLVFKADLIGISVITPTAKRAYQLARHIIKVSGAMIPLVMGGPHVTFLPDEALNWAPYIIRGPAEESILEFVEWIKESGNLEELKKLLGVSFIKNGVRIHNSDRSFLLNLDNLPFPDLNLIEGVGKMKIIPIQTSRGCPYNCSFCTVWKMWGRKVIHRSVDNVLDEIDSKKPKKVFFCDDNFTIDPFYVEKLLEGVEKRGLKFSWTAQVGVDVGRYPYLLKYMAKTGCRWVYIGLESINFDSLTEWKKKQTPAEIQETVEKIHQAGINIHGMFVLGADSDSYSTIKENVKFALKNKIESVQFSVLTPLPGAEDTIKFQKEGRIITQDYDYYGGQHVVFKPRKMTPWQLQKASLKSSARFYLNSLFQKPANRKIRKSLLFKSGALFVMIKWIIKNFRFLKWLKEGKF